MNGIINVYKERGFTSHDVVAKLRGILHQKRIGHTGTLDPEAEGVLPVCVGTATRLCEMLTDKRKVYETVMLFGIATDTEDMTGTVMKRLPVRATRKELEEVLRTFTGEQLQLPPMYSAIKVDGKKLYELAREGKTVERKRRPVTIDCLELLDSREDEQGFLCEASLRVTCGKGTYIRSLCRDIGERLGTCACMKTLLRTQSGDFLLQQSYRLSEIEEMRDQGRLSEWFISVEDFFSSCGKLQMKKEWDRLLRNGNSFSEDTCIVQPEAKEQSGQFRAYDAAGKFCGIYEYRQEKREYVPVKMFLEG